MLLDIVILPPLSVASLVADKVKKASLGYRAEFLVDNKRLWHHVSLFHVVVARNRLPLVLRLVNSFAANLPKVILKSKGVVRESRSLWLEFTYPRVLIKYKNQVIQALAPLRQGTMPYTSDRPLTPLRKMYRECYGVYYNIGRFFHPHFTLAKYASKREAEEILRKLRIPTISFSVSILAVAQVNDYGQVTRILKRFRV